MKTANSNIKYVSGKLFYVSKYRMADKSLILKYRANLVWFDIKIKHFSLQKFEISHLAFEDGRKS